MCRISSHTEELLNIYGEESGLGVCPTEIGSNGNLRGKFFGARDEHAISSVLSRTRFSIAAVAVGVAGGGPSGLFHCGNRGHTGGGRFLRALRRDGRRNSPYDPRMLWKVLVHAYASGVFLTRVSTTPAADFCRTVRADLSTLSYDSVTCSRSPEVSSTAFHAPPPNLPPAPLMDVGFAITCPLARHRRPRIKFLSIDMRVCSTFLSEPASRRRPCVSLTLHLHQVG